MLTLEKPKENQYFLGLGPARGRSPWAKAAQTYEKPKENVGFLLTPIKNLRKTILLGLGWARSGPKAKAGPEPTLYIQTPDQPHQRPLLVIWALSSNLGLV